MPTYTYSSRMEQCRRLEIILTREIVFVRLFFDAIERRQILRLFILKHHFLSFPIIAHFRLQFYDRHYARSELTL